MTGARAATSPIEPATTTDVAAFARVVETFDRRLRAIDDDALDLFWAWEAYDEEGVRFGILRTTEQVADAAVEIAARRSGAGDPPPVARRIIGRYVVAWRELWSVADRADAALDVAPEEGEWPLRQVLDHLIEAELGFLATIRNGLDQRRAGIERPKGIASDEVWLALAGVEEDPWREAFAAGIDDIREFHRAARDRIVAHLAGLSDVELGWTSPFWDGERSNRFRLGRFESHLRQHTIQAEKTVQAINGAPREVERLLRLLARALGDAEAAAIGADPELVEPVVAPLGQELRQRADELFAAVSGEASAPDEGSQSPPVNASRPASTAR
ncbi:MAG TPA: DinB family protein [Candidatus Limnocylindrales bacterium]